MALHRLKVTGRGAVIRTEGNMTRPGKTRKRFLIFREIFFYSCYGCARNGGDTL